MVTNQTAVARESPALCAFRVIRLLQQHRMLQLGARQRRARSDPINGALRPAGSIPSDSSGYTMAGSPGSHPYLFANPPETATVSVVQPCMVNCELIVCTPATAPTTPRLLKPGTPNSSLPAKGVAWNMKAGQVGRTPRTADARAPAEARGPAACKAG